MTTQTGYSICSICDIGCQVRTESEDGRVTRIIAHDNPLLAKNICFKGVAAPSIHNAPDRLRVPLKRVGERGENRWQEISYEQAMDEIAERLKKVVSEYGPEGMAVSTSGWNTQTTQAADRRFMNLLGAPNWISGVSLCAGNTAAINRLTYGWFPMGDFQNTNCIVLFGHNPKKHSWTPIYNMIEAARARGAKVIVLDPRVSEQAEVADVHLRLRSGTDAAMCLGWLKVIFDEGLYDKKFVAKWCTGFDELKARVDEYPLERVSAITGVDQALIAEAARLYATADGAIIPWTPITDMQISSTSAIRLHSILRAVTGNLDVVGGETLGGFNPDMIPESELALHDVLSDEQKAKQLGYEKHPAYTYRVAEMLKAPTEKVWGYPYADIVMGCHMANPSEVFRAMAYEDPYPIKAFFALGNNALMSYPNQHQIHKAMLNQDLIVAHELFMTPTAMMADYVLPGDAFSERNHIADTWSWTTRLGLSQKWQSRPSRPVTATNSGGISPCVLASKSGSPGPPMTRCSTTGCRVPAAASQISRRRVSWRFHPCAIASIARPALPHLQAKSSCPPRCWGIWVSIPCLTSARGRRRQRSSPTWYSTVCAKIRFFRPGNATLKSSETGVRCPGSLCTLMMRNEKPSQTVSGLNCKPLTVR